MVNCKKIEENLKKVNFNKSSIQHFEWQFSNSFGEIYLYLWKRFKLEGGSNPVVAEYLADKIRDVMGITPPMIVDMIPKSANPIVKKRMRRYEKLILKMFEETDEDALSSFVDRICTHTKSWKQEYINVMQFGKQIGIGKTPPRTADECVVIWIQLHLLQRRRILTGNVTAEEAVRNFLNLAYSTHYELRSKIEEFIEKNLSSTKKRKNLNINQGGFKKIRK